MKVKAVKTRKLLPPQDDLWEVLETVIPKLGENMVVAVASKIVAIGQGRCIPLGQVTDKDKLIIKEAEKYLPRENTPGGWVMHTIKNNLLIPTAGIDESNARGHLILWPQNLPESAGKIWKFLRQKSGLKNIGVVITDSHSIPMRRGVVGISLAHFGFKSLFDYNGREDLFGRKLKFSKTNLPDSLATAAVLAMGEGDEQTPIAIISDLPKTVEFIQKAPRKPADPSLNFEIPQEFDIYQPFLTSVPWKKGGAGR